MSDKHIHIQSKTCSGNTGKMSGISQKPKKITIKKILSNFNKLNTIFDGKTDLRHN